MVKTLAPGRISRQRKTDSSDWSFCAPFWGFAALSKRENFSQEMASHPPLPLAQRVGAKEVSVIVPAVPGAEVKAIAEVDMTCAVSPEHPIEVGLL